MIWSFPSISEMVTNMFSISVLGLDDNRETSWISLCHWVCWSSLIVGSIYRGRGLMDSRRITESHVSPILISICISFSFDLFKSATQNLKKPGFFVTWHTVFAHLLILCTAEKNRHILMASYTYKHSLSSFALCFYQVVRCIYP